MKLFWLMMLGLIIGCGPTHFQYTRFAQNSTCFRQVYVYIDESFNDQEIIKIDDAIMRWNYALNGFIKLTIISYHTAFNIDVKTDIYATHGLMIHQVTSTNPNIPPQKEKGMRTVAWTDEINGHEIFLIKDRLSINDIFPIMLHELAHFLGTHHMNDPGLMNNTYLGNNYQCIDLPTIEQIADIYEIPYKELNYCILVYGAN